MKTSLENLPSDVAILHCIISGLAEEKDELYTKNSILVAENSSLLTRASELLTENTALSTKNQDLLTELELLQEQLTLLKAKRFGKSSEKLDKQIAELELRIEESEVLNPVVVVKAGEKQKPKRKKLPEHLPRIDIVLNPPTICPSCGGEKFRKINDDTSETLEYIPSSFKVHRYIRPRCACINCEQIVQAYVPSKTIDKGKAGSSLLAHIMAGSHNDTKILQPSSPLSSITDL